VTGPRRNNLAFNLDMVGKKMDTVPFTYDEDRVILYFLGIGAGVEELDFVYEKKRKNRNTVPRPNFWRPLWKG